MARRFFAIAFRALHVANKESMLDVEIVSSTSEQEAERKGLEDLKLQRTQEDGWSDWVVNVQAIPPDIIDRVVWEARCFDQTGVSHLYGIVIVAIAPDQDQTAFSAGYSLATSETHAQVKLEQYTSTTFPTDQGWIVVETAMEEWDVRVVIPRGRRKRFDMSSCCRHH